MLKILLAKMDEQGFGDFRHGVPPNAIPADSVDSV